MIVDLTAHRARSVYLRACALLKRSRVLLAQLEALSARYGGPR